MTTGLTISMASLIAFCVLAEAAREVCFKQAANHAALLTVMMKPITWLGVFFWGIELVAWTVVLEHVRLSIAFPLMALTYIAIVLAGALILKEPVNVRQAVGACFITAGVACVGATGL
jgi:undecaprenyl phosphate-alpha-L-ara4N flippase subunit ArnE